MKFVNCRNKKRTEQIVSGNNNLFPRENLIFNLPFCWPTATTTTTTFLTSLVPPRPHSYIHIRIYICIYAVAQYFSSFSFSAVLYIILQSSRPPPYISPPRRTQQLHILRRRRRSLLVHQFFKDLAGPLSREISKLPENPL